MTNRAQREKESAAIVEPFVEEWLKPAGSHFAAFRNWAVSQVLWEENLSDGQIEEAVSVDGPGDMGIDAWYLTTEESPRVLYLVQSKDTRATKEDLDKLKNGFIDLFHPTKGVNANGEIKSRAAELLSQINNGITDITIEMHLVTSKLVSRNLRTDGEPLWNEDISVLGTTFATAFYVHDVESLAANIRVIQEQPIAARFTLARDDFFEYQTQSKFLTLSAAIRADELARLFSQHRSNLFRLNPRYFLTTKSAVNKEILATLNSEDAENFYLYNNGITATCNAIGPYDSSTGRIEFNDFQIVNGCQTTVTIHEKWRQIGGTGSLETVRVPIRVIETPAARQMAGKVAHTTNRQNQMKQEDFRSGDSVQAKLQAEFDLLSPRWFYEYKRGTWNTDYRSAHSRLPYMGEPFAPRRIQMKDLAQACLAFQERPDDATDRVSAYFASEERYRQVFPVSSKAQQLLLPHILFLKAGEIAKSNAIDYAWSTSYLRFPIVACVANALRHLLQDSSLSYFETEMSERIVSSVDDWTPVVFPLVFRELARSVDNEAQSGRGIRSIVRGRTWLEDVYRAVQNSIDSTLNAEKQVAQIQGVEASSIGLRSVLPVVI